jgi:N-acetylmuramoyl-L-alanine amidase
MKFKTALQTLLLLSAWLCLQNFNVLENTARTGRKNSDSAPGRTLSLQNPDDYFSLLQDLGPLYRMKKVVLDAGHGGKDPGCKGAISHEKNNTLAIVLKLGALIKTHYPHIEVIYTRETDVFIELNERAAIANRNNADLFISVHCNAVSTSKIHGIETYVLGQHRAADNLEVAKRENAVITLEENYKQNYDGYDPDSPEAHIFSAVYQSAYLEQSILFASLVQHHATEITERVDKGVKQAGFLVLRETAMPSVLVETGYLTNRAEEAYIASEEGQDAMALAIFNAFSDYKSQVEGTADAAKPLVQTPRPTPRAQPVAQKETVANPEKKSVTPQKPATLASGKTPDKPQATAKTTPQYRILLMSWPNRLDRKTGQLSLLDDIQEEQKDGKYYYFTGKYNQRPEADKMLQEIKNLGFKTAYVVELPK